ncbi:hypothetical protein [Streptomyces sp. NPDC059786]|uniref:hypothetical protein n=1 Tax=Streptomyces sp. NPDC059786 TaxID=3346946 RepID=UPI003659BCB4
MSGSFTPQHRTAVHQILRHAHDLLNASNEEDLPLATLLARAADNLPDKDCEHLEPSALARAVAEAASQLLARCSIPIKPGDPTVLYCLQVLDQLPRTARTGLLTVAIRYTEPDAHGTQPPVTRVPATGRHMPARSRMTEPCPCPCPCNSDGPCGGCGHAGCGGRQ